MDLSLHRCKVCGTRWLLWPDSVHGGGWNLLDKYSKPGSCCDNMAMGDQIEHLRDFELQAEVSSPATPQPKCVIGEYCRLHQFIHGAEAEELRERLEKLVNETRGSGRLRDDIRALLDDVDARDSCAFLESGGKRVVAASPATPALERVWAVIRQMSTASEPQLMGDEKFITARRVKQWSIDLTAALLSAEKAVAARTLPASQEEK